MFRVILLGAIFFLLPHSDVIPIRVFELEGDFPWDYEHYFSHGNLPLVHREGGK